MRTLLALLLCRLVPAKGNHRAQREPTAVTVPPRAVRPTAPPLDGHDVALVRPYLVAWETAQEQRRQRERRRPEVVGQDYPTGRVA